jgi:hypothetical protein
MGLGWGRPALLSRSTLQNLSMEDSRFKNELHKLYPRKMKPNAILAGRNIGCQANNLIGVHSII